jgi:hypothetical protein
LKSNLSSSAEIVLSLTLGLDMTTQMDIEIHNALVDYLAGNTSLDRFRDWFDETTWTVDESDDRAAQALAGEIELRIAEYLNGHRDESELRQALLPQVRTFSHGMLDPRITLSTNTTLRRGATLLGAGIRVEKVFA